MTKGNIFHHVICRLLPAVAMLLAAGSCTTGEISGSDDDQPVIVTAYATESALTRTVTYQDYGDVTSGTYYLAYPRNGLGPNFAEVEFGADGYGKAIAMPNRGQLTWKQIGNGNSDRSLGLTNVSPEKHNNYDKDNPYVNPIVFKDDETQFVAGRYIPYGELNTNDILLASKSQYRNGTTQDHTSNYVHFELHHCMARVRVIVETHPDKGSFDPLDGLLEKAMVDITNVVLKPYSFIPFIGDKTNFSDVVSISEDGTLNNCRFDNINLLNTLYDADSEWAETGNLNQEEYPDGKYFTTYDILLPPQMLRENDRPRLVITVPDETKPNGVKTYSGVLPHVMFDDKDNQFQFEFLAEHLLTIRTMISNDLPELIFMPAKVVEWVDKGSFSLDAQQAGIYTENDFMRLIECYNGENPKKLLQFGTCKNDKWVFDIFSNLSLSGDIAEQMKVENGKQDYSFNFNTWYTVKVDGSQVTETKLKSILSGMAEQTQDKESAADVDPK